MSGVLQQNTCCNSAELIITQLKAEEKKHSASEQTRVQMSSKSFIFERKECNNEK